MVTVITTECLLVNRVCVGELYNAVAAGLGMEMCHTVQAECRQSLYVCHDFVLLSHISSPVITRQFVLWSSIMSLYVWQILINLCQLFSLWISFFCLWFLWHLTKPLCCWLLILLYAMYIERDVYMYMLQFNWKRNVFGPISVAPHRPEFVLEQSVVNDCTCECRCHALSFLSGINMICGAICPHWSVFSFTNSHAGKVMWTQKSFWTLHRQHTDTRCEELSVTMVKVEMLKPCFDAVCCTVEPLYDWSGRPVCSQDLHHHQLMFQHLTTVFEAFSSCSSLTTESGSQDISTFLVTAKLVLIRLCRGSIFGCWLCNWVRCSCRSTSGF